MPRSFDINIDCGESFGNWSMGADENLMPHVTTANLACGFHAGDPMTMVNTVLLAKEHGVKNIAVIEKGWLGGGNTGRNTTIIRSNLCSGIKSFSVRLLFFTNSFFNFFVN